MKILYIPGRYPFCYYYRGYLPGVYSNQTVVSDFMRRDMKVNPDRLTELSKKADVVVFQRPTDSQTIELATLLKMQGKKIIFENDDTYTSLPLEKLGNEKAVALAHQMADNLKTFLKIADGAIASTDFLAREYGEFNENITVLKNCIDPKDEYKCKENKTGKFRVGFIGSVTSNDDYEHIKEDIRRLDERGDVTIVIMGVKHKDGSIFSTSQPDYQFWNSLKNIEWHPYCHITEYMLNVSDLALDLAIIPRKDHYFNKCKSNIKFLEMSLLRIPVLAQGFKDGRSPYQGKDEGYMTVILDNWYDEVIKIKDNHAKYKELADKAHDYVLENYNISTYGQEWTNQIEKLCE